MAGQGYVSPYAGAGRSGGGYVNPYAGSPKDRYTSPYADKASAGQRRWRELLSASL